MAKQRELVELFRDLTDEPLESLKGYRGFSDRFYADIFKGKLDRLAWNRLNKRQLICLVLRYYPLNPNGIVTWEDIARCFKVSRERARQIGVKALHELTKTL